MGILEIIIMEYPPFLPDNEKTNWSHLDSFGTNPMFWVNPFVHYNYSLGMHTHDFYEVNIVLRGHGAHYFAGHVFELEMGDTFIIPPAVRHGYYNCGGLDVYHILVHCDFFRAYDGILGRLPSYNAFFNIAPRIREHAGLPLMLRLSGKRFDEIVGMLNYLANLYTSGQVNQYDTLNQSDLYENTAVSSYTLYLFTLLIKYNNEQIMSQGSWQDDQNRSVIRSIENICHDFDKKLDINQLAREAAMSRNTYYKVFNRYTGKSPGAFITDCRITHSKELLTSTDLPVTVVALQVGFYDSSHFIRCFKTHVGMSPSDYKKLKNSTLYH